MDKEVKSYEFKAEVKQLLHLLAYSLYKNKEIFLRELISNASDALSKIRYIKLTTQEEIEDRDIDLEIEIIIDKKERTIKVVDTGIGMTEEELIENIGTIAKSGTLEFLKKLEAGSQKEIDAIGQFGVGFYSSFIVADKVRIITKSYKKGVKAVEWESDGTGSFTIKETEKKRRGTEVILHLKKDEDEFLEKYRIEQIIQKYSNFISYPILIEKGQINKIEAIWLKPKTLVKEEEYIEFYKFITHRNDEPLFYHHIIADAPYQFRALLYCPKTSFDLFQYQITEYGLSLYTNKVLIQQECKDLLPRFLRFIKGVVDSEDVPLNISRETIQNNNVVLKIKSIITKNIIELLEKMMNEEKNKYLEFYKEYKTYIKEGIVEDWENKEKLGKLLLFNSSKCKDENEYISLKEYIDRMYPEQKEIYYICGTNRDTIENSPYIEIFKKKDIEVLYLFDPIDEIVVNNLSEFNEKKFKSIEQANLDSIKEIKKEEEKKEEKKEEDKETQKRISKLIKYFKELLKDKVKDVVESNRLVDSPCVLVHPEEGMSFQTEKIMKIINKDFKGTKRVLEINPENKIIKNLAIIYERDKDNEFVKNVCFQLYENCLLIEGNLEQPVDTIKRINSILNEAVELKSK
ncbi:MAG TPA: molecular chaperone HtpG [bacterium]|nr:molecular chaperone HtpG [bacterium]HOL47530.1 molecular chaperone HtpG [bacterium]HPQ19118.1 molecular chaperone HtpG [bacterium]